VVVVARVAWQKETERWDTADVAEVDQAGRLRVWSPDGRLLAVIEPGDWIDARANDGPVIQPPQAF
jgi:hypothetical protein